MRLPQVLKVIGLFIVPFLSAHETCHMQVLKGEAIRPYVKDITDLCLVVYREFPYLYEGTEEEYMPAIEHYAQSPLGIACVLFDNQKLVGIAIGEPMGAMREKYKQPLLNFYSESELDAFFYFGEFLLLKEYREKGLGQKMYFELEKQINEEGQLRTICFCKIAEFDKHPLMPKNYKSLDEFWTKLGFSQREEIATSVFWRNIGEEEDSPHKMIYWVKSNFCGFLSSSS